MDPFTAISMGISVVGGVTKMIDGFSKKKAAEERMRKLEAAPLPLNAYEALQLPTEGTKQRTEALERQRMDTTATLQQAGTRAMGQSLGKLNEQSIEGMRKIGIDTDEAIFKKDQMIADEQANIYDVQEQRLSGAMSSASSDIESGTEALYGGMSDIANVGLAIGQNNEANAASEFGSQTPSAMRQQNRIAQRNERGGSQFKVGLENVRGSVFKGVKGLFKKNK
jgi:hypothetical protein